MVSSPLSETYERKRKKKRRKRRKSGSEKFSQPRNQRIEEKSKVCNNQPLAGAHPSWRCDSECQEVKSPGRR